MCEPIQSTLSIIQLLKGLVGTKGFIESKELP